MKEIKIESIEDGAYYDDIVWDYWITAILNNGKRIRIFDPQGISGELKQMVGNNVPAKIKTLFIQKEKADDLESFEGMISKVDDQLVFKNDQIEIVLNESDLMENQLQPGDSGTFYFGRFDLVRYEGA